MGEVSIMEIVIGMVIGGVAMQTIIWLGKKYYQKRIREGIDEQPK